MGKLIRVAGIIGLVCLTTYFDCGSNYPPPTAGGGFYIQTLINGAFESLVSVGGSWNSDSSGAQGSVFSFSYTTDPLGNYYVANGRAPATWTFTEYSGACEGLSTTGPVGLTGTSTLNCYSGGVGDGEFAISPSTVYSSSPPATVSITGSGFSTTYGMPQVAYYYNDGTYVGEVTATTANPTTISAAPPSGLSSDPSGIYVGEIQNATAGGGWQTVGVVALNLVTPTPPQIGGGGGKGGGGCKQGQVCNQGTD
ncbi:MAG: hypothetical protein WBD25_15500 [Terriglobales bacterium]